MTILKALLVLLVLIPSLSFAVDCSNPPKGFGNSWARAYQQWCESCCGTYSPQGPRCIPGSNWGCGGKGTGGSQPSSDNEAERRRQEEADKQKQKEAEEAKRKQAEFEKNKQETLKDMKGTSGSDLDLKDAGTSGDLKLKGGGEIENGSSKPKEVADKKRLTPVRVSKANCPTWDPNKPSTVRIDEKTLCPGNLTCKTYTCGAGMGCSYVCCPKGLPYLNHCDCKCYRSTDFKCNSYSKCEPR
jgi:hypothetical protein